jgi:Protein of unknown function (DUF1097)
MKTFLAGCIFGLFGAAAVALTFAAHWPTWVLFIAWVSYYIFGKTVKSSAIAFGQIVLGIVMGLAIQVAGTHLSGLIGGLGLPVAVFFFIGSLAYVMKVKTINNIPAWFMGLIVFFGIRPPIEPQPILDLLVPLATGFVLAWMNDNAVYLIQSTSKN